MPTAPDRVLVEHGHRHRVMAPRQLARRSRPARSASGRWPACCRGRGRGSGAMRPWPPGRPTAGHVVMGADDQALHAGARVPVPGSGRSGRRAAACPRRGRGDDLVVDVMRHLPAQASRRRARGRGRRPPRPRPARPLGVERVPGAEPDEDEAPALGVRHGQPPEARGGPRRTRAAPPSSPPGSIVGDVLALEHADHDRVGVGLPADAGGRGFDVHPPRT